MTAQTDTGAMALADCPFCGSPSDYVGKPGAGYRVECRGCLAQSGWGDYGYQVKDKWNTRTALRSASQPGREEIARIIAPEVFAKEYVHYYPDRSTIEGFTAYKKADAILALSAPAPQDRAAIIDDCIDVVRQWTAAEHQDMARSIIADLKALKSREWK